MIPLLMDEHVPDALTEALRSRGVDVERVQDVELRSTHDPIILEWAAVCGRVFVTSDRNTVPGFAYDRVAADLPVAGVVILKKSLTFGEILDDLTRLVLDWTPEKIRDQVVVFLPLSR